MSMVVEHLRWNDVTDEQAEALERVFAQAQHGSSGCWSASLRRQGGAAVATAVFASRDSAVAFCTGELQEATDYCSLGDPQEAAFEVPSLFAAGYRRPTAAAVEAATVPQPRGTDDRATVATS